MKKIISILLVTVLIGGMLFLIDKNKEDSLPIVDLNQVTKNIDNSLPIVDEKQTEVSDSEKMEERMISTPYHFDGNIIHALVMQDSLVYQTVEKIEVIGNIKKGEFVNIVSESEELYEIEYADKHGYVEKEFVKYYVFHQEKRYTLGSDVSHFNYGTNFKDSGEFAYYLLQNDFNYVIIRMGGKGYGKPGKMYYDKKTDFFASVCEHLGIPYGYYFLDEAITEDEVMEEVHFVLEYLQKHPGKFDVLPISIDMEYQHGSGRADLVWEERVELVNKLIEEFKKENIDCMVYANGARIETYLKNVNCPYWTAMYPVDHKIPTVFYDEYIREQERINKEHPENVESSVLNTKDNKGGTETMEYSEEYFNKVVGWQFTEEAASLDGIDGMLDLSLMDNEFFEKYYYPVLEK